ncbi:Cof-type HAD-IIB family hydrolase [Parabacteroides sp. Marseille-P3160]|uniref:Cof-type HAD-IIB family hydrolase n=1 Tax=Parabacteroides sp. Marseille-P3160 TaxID=1917887 RepID=UPI0009BC3D9C|nr:Cof-type HAD-IIB family hydrolase [Parabacteroides sp. Marseille-P3160]
MVKAIFLDIDGTLVSFNTHRVPDSTRRALEEVRKKGIMTFVATGRHQSAINNLDDIPFDGYITLNGGYCFAGKEVLYKRSISPEDIESFVRYQQEVRSFPCMSVEENEMTVNLVDDEVRFLFQLLKFRSVPIRPIEYILDKEIYQLVAFFTPEEESEVMKALPHCTAARWHPTFADVVTTGVDKGLGIDKIAARFGFTVEETMAFGDGGNDIAMLRHAGIGVAMGNALDHVKKEADYVTDTVDEDGIRKAFQHFGLI